MNVNLVTAVVSGVLATAVITVMMALGPRMGMPKMDMPAMLGSMFGAPGNKVMGIVMHFMMGIIFALIYGVLFGLIPGFNLILLGATIGVGHWLIVGLLMGAMPMLHAGMKSGDVAAPGIYSSSSGMMGFVGGLMGHVVFGLVAGIVYGLLTGGFGG